jgi:hypothetical protein
MGSSYHCGGKEPFLRFSQASKYVQHMYLWRFMLYSYRHQRFSLALYSPRRDLKVTVTSKQEQQEKTASEDLPDMVMQQGSQNHRYDASISGHSLQPQGYAQGYAPPPQFHHTQAYQSAYQSAPGAHWQQQQQRSPKEEEEGVDEERPSTGITYRGGWEVATGERRVCVSVQVWSTAVLL